LLALHAVLFFLSLMGWGGGDAGHP
jgi:hypothetical protein